MSREALFAAIGGVGDDLIVRADTYRVKPSAHWQRWLPLAACAAVVITVGAFALRMGRLSPALRGNTQFAASEAAPAEAPMAAEPKMETAAAEEAPAEAEECCPAEEAPAYAARADSAEAAPVEGTLPAKKGEALPQNEINDERPPRVALLPELTLFGQTFTLLPDDQDGGALTVDTDLGEVWAEVDGGRVYILGDEYVVVGEDMLYPRYVVCFTDDGDTGVYQIAYDP